VRRKGYTRQPWTDAEDAILRKHSPADAARLTGRTMRSVYARRPRAGVPPLPRDSRRDTALAEARVMLLDGGLAAAEIARRQGVTSACVSATLIRAGRRQRTLRPVQRTELLRWEDDGGVVPALG
jgi:hypothetical protein